MDSFDLADQRIVQLEQIPSDIRHEIERGDGVEYALDLSLNRLRIIDHVGVFEHVCQLDLSSNQIESVNGIQALRHLQILDLSRNCVVSIDLLALVPTLRELKVAENSLTTIDSLQLLPELRVVDASYNRIGKWPSLAGLKVLETLDLSDNMLGAFSSSQSKTFLPPQLRRLSIARNQVDTLCGIASLGLQSPLLEFFVFDENPVIQHVRSRGGQLERLTAAFFPCLPLSSDGGLTISSRRREEFAVSPLVLTTITCAVSEGREAVLTEFLVAGNATAGVNGGEQTFLPPPPAPVDHLLPIRNQAQLNGFDDADPSTPFSHAQKMEMWKQIQDDRKPEFAQGNGALLPTNHMKSSRVHWAEERAHIDAPLQGGTRDGALTVSELRLPDPPSSREMPVCEISNLSEMKPLETAELEPQMISTESRGAAVNDALGKKVKILTDQVATMRKYMKVWIKREKMVRDASVKKLQRWVRRLQRENRLRQRVLLAKQRREKEYCFQHCSTNLLWGATRRFTSQERIQSGSAQSIQRHVRGFIVRTRIVRFKKLCTAARRIQHTWRKVLQERQAVLQGNWKLPHGSSNVECARWCPHLNAVLRCSRDVKQLQQVCAVQDTAIDFLWNNQVRDDPSATTKAEKNVVRVQRLWRGHSVWKRKPNSNTADSTATTIQHSTDVKDDMKDQLDQQALEIKQLKQQIAALQQMVANLAVAKANSAD